MSMLKINNVDMPSPSTMTIGIQDISKAERNAKATMIIERIATKRKLELSWSYLTQAQLSKLLNAISNTMFNVTYHDPQTNALRTTYFYAGDRSIPVLDVKDGVVRYKDFKVNLIER